MIVVDVETGGLNPNENPMLSLGAMNELGETFYSEILPTYGTLNAEALKINDYDPAKWQNNDLKETLEKFYKWCNNDFVLAGHNPSFDLNYLQTSSKIVGLKCPFGYRTIDLHSVAYIYCKVKDIPFTKLTSDEIYPILDIEPEPKPHNALNGAVWERMALVKIKELLCQ